MVADRGPATSAVTIIFVVLCTVFVAARFYTRIFLVRSVKQDDYWILAAWVAAVGFSISICVGVHFGLGKHTSDISGDDFVALRKAEYVFSVLYNPSLMLTKTSIVIFYLSVMSKDVDPVFKWSNWLTLAVVNVAGLALTFLNIFQCRHVSDGWTYPLSNPAGCKDIVTLYLSSAPVNIITDLAILFLPMPILTGMRLPKKQKIILIFTFSFGAFVTAVDVVRIAYLQNASVTRFKTPASGSSTNTHILEQSDFPWYASLSFMWSAVEVNLGIICACVPSLKPLFSRFMPNMIRDAGEEMTPMGSIDEGSMKPDNLARIPTASTGDMVTNPAAFRKPTVKEYSGDDDGDEMGFLNMLAGPDDDAPNQLSKRPTNRLRRKSTSRSTKSTASDFDFVSMGGKRNMLKLTNHESVWPIAVVTVIFFLWGFAYGLLDTLNGKFQTVAGVKRGPALGLHAAYYAGYLVGPLTLGQFMLKKYGFKAAMMAGLCVYGCGTLVFWPSAVLLSYTAFVISNFIVAFGLSCLEIAANPYIALCGPLEYAEARLNFSQGFQAIGSIFSPLLATKVLFKGIANSPDSLVNVQWTYLGIALFVIGLAVVFYYIPLPEASDEQLEAMAERREAVYNRKVGPYRVVWVTLALGVFSQWCYVGSQEAVNGNVENLIDILKPKTTIGPFYLDTVFRTVFAVGRFIAAFLNYIMKPRYILLFLYTGLVVCCALQMKLNGDAGEAINQMISFFQAGTFSIIYAISMRGMGSHTKTAASYMTAAISGGTIAPVIQWAVANGHGLQYSYCVPLAFYVAGALFPIYLNSVPAARNQVDPTHENRNARRAARKTGRRESQMTDPGDESRQFGLVGILARRRKAKAVEAQETSTQHIETKDQSLSTSISSSAMEGGLTEKDILPEGMHLPKFMRSPADKEKNNHHRGGEGESGDLAMWSDETKPGHGEIGDLAPWPGEHDDHDFHGGNKEVNVNEKEKKGGGSSSSNDDADMIERAPAKEVDIGHHVGEEDYEDDDEDDEYNYHAFMRRR